MLLTKGYLQGRLDFKYKHVRSAGREEYLLKIIEEEEFSKVRYLRAITDSVIGAGCRSEGMITAAFKSYDDYLGLTLPYLVKKPKLGPEVTKRTMADVKAYLQKKRLELGTVPPEKKPS